MKFLGFDKVLCLSPHPDDVEISMSGTIKKFNETEFDIFTLSQGTGTDMSSSTKRYDEVKKFWEKLNLKNVNLIFSEHHSLEDLRESQFITYIEKQTNYHQYNAICGTPFKDSHFEHRLVGTNLYALSRHYSCSTIEYKTPSTLYDWKPNLIVDITNTHCKKHLQVFASQLDSPYLHRDVLEVFFTDFMSYRKKHKIVEQFCIKTLFQ